MPAGSGLAAELERVLLRGHDETLALVASLTRDRQAVAAQSGQQVDILVHIARRLAGLVGRALNQLDQLERSVEDPDELDALFRLDNLITLQRRSIESLAVLGGGRPRQIREPAEIQAVLRTAIGETEQYARMQVVACPPGTIPGFAVVEIAGMLAELLENSASYSRPDTRVHIRAQRAEDGSLDVLVEDRALAMPDGQVERLNYLLAHPERADLTGQLREGKIGIIVVAQIARRHGATVHLAPRTDTPGYRATVTLPPRLVTTPTVPSPTEDTMPLTALTPRPATLPTRGPGHLPAPDQTGPRPSATGPARPLENPGNAPLPVRTRQQHLPQPAITPPPARLASGRGFADAVAAAEALHGNTPPNHPSQILNHGERR
ncbi:ATP-binding protein [Streptomyces sp. NPDC059247]|uniref:ATP-binding protein n=1 Tax=Streptomyces sp. NPDC059247 TaxID=3346790 RepID=UPI0036D0043A